MRSIRLTRAFFSFFLIFAIRFAFAEGVDIEPATSKMLEGTYRVLDPSARFNAMFNHEPDPLGTYRFIAFRRDGTIELSSSKETQPKFENAEGTGEKLRYVETKSGIYSISKGRNPEFVRFMAARIVETVDSGDGERFESGDIMIVLSTDGRFPIHRKMLRKQER